MRRKLPIVGVFGQGTPIDADHAQLAKDVGALLARLGTHLLTGGGYGVMEAAAAAFVAVSDRAGLSIGVVPCDPDGPFDLPDQLNGRRYPNPHVEITIMTPLQSFTDDWRRTPTRNHVNVLSADVIIALPGNKGTRNELDMAAEYCGEAARSRQERRTVLYGPADRFTTRYRELFVHAEKLGEVETHLRRVLAARGLAPGSPI